MCVFDMVKMDKLLSCYHDDDNNNICMYSIIIFAFGFHIIDPESVKYHSHF